MKKHIAKPLSADEIIEAVIPDPKERARVQAKIRDIINRLLKKPKKKKGKK